MAGPPPPPTTTMTRLPRKRVRAPRKSTATRRSEEKASLVREIETLRAQLRRTRRTEAESRREKTVTGSTTASTPRIQQLQHAERDHALWIAGLRGFLRSYEATQPRAPLRVPLVLTADPAQRRETVRQLHATKLRDAHAFVRQQCGSLDLSTPYVSFDKFQDRVTGKHTITSLASMPFPDIDSVRRVYDAMCFWMSNVELCITDELGTLTIREDDEDDGTTDVGDAYSSLRRVRSALECGVSIEGNFAIFRELFSGVNDSDDGSYAVLTIQPVDDDALFPFHPDECVKVEITGAILITTLPSQSGVVLTRWATLELHDTTNKLSSERIEAVGRDAARWFEVLHHVLRERVFASGSGPS